MEKRRNIELWNREWHDERIARHVSQGRRSWRKEHGVDLVAERADDVRMLWVTRIAQRLRSS